MRTSSWLLRPLLWACHTATSVAVRSRPLGTVSAGDWLRRADITSRYRASSSLLAPDWLREMHHRRDAGSSCSLDALAC